MESFWRQIMIFDSDFETKLNAYPRRPGLAEDGYVEPVVVAGPGLGYAPFEGRRGPARAAQSNDVQVVRKESVVNRRPRTSSHYW
jgi:hypothetical protein